VGSGHKELVLKNVSGLTIRRQGDGGVAEIVSASPYARVLSFEGGDTITLENLTLGHKAEGPCSAGVLAFSSVSDISIGSCDLYGSGSIGLELTGCSNVMVETSIIRECTAGALAIEDSSSLSFDYLSITNNTGSYPLIAVSNTQSVYFSSCIIEGNSGDTFLYFGEGTEDWGFEYCSIAANEIEALNSGDDMPYFLDCSVSDNFFDEELAGFLSSAEEGYDGEGYEGEGDGDTAYWTLESVPLGFYYPAWFDIEDLEDGGLTVSDPDSESGILILKAYALIKGEDPDTQASAIFKKAAAALQKLLGEKGLKLKPRIGTDYVETEAHPYYYNYMHPFTMNNDSGYAFFKLVHSNSQIWAFIAMSQNQEDISEDTYLGSILASIEEIE